MTFTTCKTLILKYTALKIFAGSSVLSFFGAAVFTFGSVLIQNRSASAQDRNIKSEASKKLLAAAEDEEELLKLIVGTKRAKTIAEIPAQIRTLIKAQYERSPEVQREVKFEQFLANRYFWAFEAIENKNWINSSPVALSDMCNDGILRTTNVLNPSVWSGAWTGGDTSVISDPNLPIAIWNNGILSGNNLDVGVNNPSLPMDSTACNNHPQQAHHTVVTTGGDPTAPIPTTAPGETHSIRLGNRCYKNGAEKLKKTFKVTSNTFSFWYAIVMTNRHGTQFSTQPGFGVYLYDQNNNPIAPAAIGLDLDVSQAGMNEFLPANFTNIWQTSSIYIFSPILYKNWAPVSLDLSAYIGQNITIVLANRDCLGTYDWAYTYVGGFCRSTLGAPTGSAEFNADKSDCAKGEICFDYTVPKAPNGTTGKVNLTLELYQNGSLVKTLSSGDLTSNGTYCFKNANGLNALVGGFDWSATANFTIAGATISPKEIGKKGDGFTAGINNDCVIKNCCGIGTNYVKNGDFNGDFGDKPEFDSVYEYSQELFPGNIFIGNSGIADKACKNWIVKGHAGGNCEKLNDPFLMVNGKTSQAGSAPVSVWSQQVKVDGEGEYEFCAFFKDLKQCCFNQKPQITMKAKAGGNETTQTATISTSNKACDWWLISTKIKVPAGASTVDLQILLDESLNGDGNDLAIDDISLTKKQNLPIGETNFLFGQAAYTDAAHYTITAAPNKPQKPDCKYIWTAVELNSSNNPILSTKRIWTIPPANTGTFAFGGFPGTAGTSPGVFEVGKTYEFSYRAECDCSNPQTTPQRYWVGFPVNSKLKPTKGTPVPNNLIRISEVKNSTNK